MTKRRIAITGMGLISPVGNTVAMAWDNVVNGRSGVGPVTRFDTSELNTHFAAEVKDFDATDYIDRKLVRRCDIFMHYGIAASKMAFADSGLSVDTTPADRIGIAIGSGIGGITTIEENYEKYRTSGSARKISPFFVPGSIINMVAGQVSIDLGLTGPNFSIVTACTTGAHNIGMGARCIAYGDADVMLTGGAEMATSVLGMGGFNSAKALSTRNDAPTEASRPWDVNRDGFVLADGAGSLVLEEWEHAKKRGATIYAELLGFGMSGDAHHITAPEESGAGAASSMRSALNDAKCNPADIDYVNAHATSTLLGDRAEVKAMKTVFGDAVSSLAVSSTKSVTGHMLGASGAAEAIFSIMALRDQVLPPTINLHEPDPECDLDFVPLTARETNVDRVVSNSFGFGGTNGTLVLGRAS
ncbi:MAG: beta-ketoacyl-ACP synthase II [Gammaproteobacteria bacterium]